MPIGPGNLTTVTFAVSGYAMIVTSIDSWTQSRDSIETTTMATANDRTFQEDDLVDVGEMTVSGFFVGSLDPILGTVNETITVDWAGDSTTNKWAATGFMVNSENGAAIGEMMTGSYTVKFTGAMTVS